ncbi:MAG: hypothetical protein JXR76_15585 [Deltaproteobacteria bacterium]|nr:hypothetical protein [Deltaproteobacteria bacterium]
MKKVMFSVDDVADKIDNGERLLLAGDEALLSSLPNGTWIGGTIPYFMAENGGKFDEKKIFVTSFPDYVNLAAINQYNERSLRNVYTDIPDNGIGFIMMPATSQTHLSFSLNAPNYSNFALHPLIGWITGVNLAELGQKTAKIVNGESGEVLDDGALVMQLQLPPGKIAEVNIVNVFEQGDGDVLVFPENGFQVKDALINGVKRNFAEYLLENSTDTRLPLVADYYGVNVNVSFQNINEAEGVVNLYAPVFKSIEYGQAKPVGDYVQRFSENRPKESIEKIVFSCNCILNYLYSDLENRQTAGVMGPITFGEIAYQLLNQTLVYVTIDDV